MRYRQIELGGHHCSQVGVLSCCHIFADLLPIHETIRDRPEEHSLEPLPVDQNELYICIASLIRAKFHPQQRAYFLFNDRQFFAVHLIPRRDNGLLAAHGFPFPARRADSACATMRTLLPTLCSKAYAFAIGRMVASSSSAFSVRFRSARMAKSP